MKISKSDIVVSLAGRDQGKLMFVLDIEDGFALLADGKTRKVSLPKRKKLKHVRFVAVSDAPVARKIREGSKVLDSEIRKTIAAFADTEKPGR